MRNFFAKNVHKVRGGFTLIELLLVVIILGVLAATIMLTAGKSVANAKANTIISNMSTVKYAALQYYANSVNSGSVLADFVKDSKVYLGALAKEDTTNNIVVSQGNINYAVQENDNKWFVKVTLDANDPDIADIRNYLEKQAESAQILSSATNPSAYKAGAANNTIYMQIK